jgi:tetratricopeptide (TPR) repeat protein
MPKKTSIQRGLSRREARDLDIEIDFLEGVVRRDPGYVDALQILGDNYTRRGRYAKGLEVDLQLAGLRPADALTHYNLACSLALTGETARAVETLHRALDLGYRDYRWLRRDPDLRGLRKHPLFKSIRERLRTLEQRNAG